MTVGDDAPDPQLQLDGIRDAVPEQPTPPRPSPPPPAPLRPKAPVVDLDAARADRRPEPRGLLTNELADLARKAIAAAPAPPSLAERVSAAALEARWHAAADGRPEWSTIADALDELTVDVDQLLQTQPPTTHDEAPRT